MTRNKVVVIKLSVEEKAAVEKYCLEKGLKAGTLGRMLLLEKVKEVLE